MDEQEIRRAIREANRQGSLGKRVTQIIFARAESAIGTDRIMLSYDDGPKTATETW